MRTRLFSLYGIIQVLAIGGFFLLGDDTWTQVYWQVAIGWTAAAVTVVGVVRHRPPGGLAWLCFGSGVFLNATGILVEAVATNVFGITTYPTPADIFWLGLYPGLVAGMVILIRRRSSKRDWTTMIDTTTITTGLGLLSWVFVIRPQAADPALGMLARAAVVAYPVADVIVLAMMVRLLLGFPSRALAFRLMVASLLCFLGGDIAWAVLYQFGISPSGTPLHVLQSVFLVAFALAGGAALHPSVRDVAQPAPAREARLSPILLLLLTLAALIAPCLLFLQATGGNITDGVAIAVASTTLFLLVVTRMAGLLRQVEIQSRHLGELSRVDPLTGLRNRRAWSAELPPAMERSRRERVPLSVGLIDLDFFKQFNDSYGHQAGDQLLKGAAAAWQENVRAVDVLARFGGEEFIVLLPDADAEQANATLDRLRRVTPAGQTFSAGVAIWDGSETSDDLIERADRALYQAKETGRNRTVVAAVDILVDRT